MITPLELVIVLFVGILGYGLAFFMIARTFVVAYSFRRDVPYVSTINRWVDQTITLLELAKGETVVDLGSGTGKFIIRAARRYPEVNFVGVEISKWLCFWTRLRARFFRLKNVEIINGDVFKQDFSRFDKIYLFMTTDFVSRIVPKVEQECKDGVRVVSIWFDFPRELYKRYDIKVFDSGILKRKIYLWQKD